jgi:hypothetical protein
MSSQPGDKHTASVPSPTDGFATIMLDGQPL